ncbi:MAG: hypothetical protein M1450_01720 [Patescibacteria group bacterium]|nr:hypothetical protein [Patescibacteria group bacterium]
MFFNKLDIYSKIGQTGYRMRFAVRYFLVFVFFVVSFLFLKSPVFAQNQTLPQAKTVNPYIAPNTNPDVPNNLHTWTQNVMIEVISAMTCQLAGVDPTNPSAKCLGVDQKTGKIGFVQNGGGAIGAMSSLISATFIPPTFTSDYAKYVARSFGLTKPSYAASQGIGYDSISPLIKIWTQVRNIVYLMFVLVFAIIGLAIMLRVKIDPRTVMTVQNQIPKIIIGLLLVTFSFAIAGLLIDLMWIVIYLFFNLALSAATPDSPYFHTLSQIQSSFNGDSVLGVFNNIIGISQMTNSATNSVNQILLDVLAVSPLQGLMGIPIIGDAFRILISAVVFLIILIAIIWSLFRLWFALIEAYIMILVGVIFAPFWIVAGLAPGGGQSAGFGAWLREMLGNLAAFPTTIGMFLLSGLFVSNFSTPTYSGQFMPPLIGNPGAPNLVSAIIGLGIIFSTPHVVKITKAAFKAPKIDLGPIGQAIGVGTGAPGGIFNKTGQIGFSLSGMANVPGIKRLPIISNIAQGRGGPSTPHP